MPQMGKQSKNNLKKEEVSTASGETEPSLHGLGELEMGQQGVRASSFGSRFLSNEKEDGGRDVLG